MSATPAIAERVRRYKEDIESHTLFEWVEVEHMFSDAYCRSVSEAKIEKNLMPFDLKKVGVIMLSFRDKENRYAVLDGLHRRAAAIKAGITRLPARVFLDLGYEEEAALYVAFATVNKQTALDKFRAKFEAGDPAALTIRQVLLRQKLDVAMGGPGSGLVSAVFALEKVFSDYGLDALDETIRLLHDAWEDNPRGYRSALLLCTAMLWARYHKMYDRDRMVETLKRIGIDGLLTRSYALREAEPALGPLGALVKTLMAAYNRGLRRGKLPWIEREITERGRAGLRERESRKAAPVRKVILEILWAAYPNGLSIRQIMDDPRVQTGRMGVRQQLQLLQAEGVVRLTVHRIRGAKTNVFYLVMKRGMKP